MEQRVQYNEVLPGDQTINTGLYSRASPVQDQQLDNSEYSRLNTRGYRSPHQPDFACNDAKNNELYSTIASTASQHNCSFTVNTGKEGGALMNKVKNLVTLLSTVGGTYCHFFLFYRTHSWCSN